MIERILRTALMLLFVVPILVLFTILACDAMVIP